MSGVVFCLPFILLGFCAKIKVRKINNQIIFVILSKFCLF